MIWHNQEDRYLDDRYGPEPAQSRSDTFRAEMEFRAAQDAKEASEAQPTAPRIVWDEDGALDIPVALGASLRRLVASWKETEGVPTHNDQDRGIRAATAACAYQLEKVLREWNLHR